MKNKTKNISEITYLSELIPDTKPMTMEIESFVSGINSHINLLTLSCS